MKKKFLIRRLGAMFYDSMVIAAILCVGTLVTLPINHGNAISAGNHLYQLYLIGLVALFFIGFWYKRGQTIGLAAWRLKIVGENDKPITLKQAIIRFLVAVPSILFFAVGFIWLLFDRNNQTLYEKLSSTKMIRLR